MADATTTAKPARKRAAFVRTVKPVYAVLNYRDADGNPIKLDKKNLTVAIEKDMDKIVEILESGDGTGTVIKIDLAPAKPAETPAA